MLPHRTATTASALKQCINRFYSIQQQGNRHRRRVVVTGLGAVTPLGCSVEAFWQSLLRSDSGIRTYPNLESLSNDEEKTMWSQIPAKIAADVRKDEFAAALQLARSQGLPQGAILDSRMALFIQYAMLASHQALVDAKWMPQSDKEKEETGVALGSGIGSVSEVSTNTLLLAKEQLKKISPFMVPKMLINMASGYVSIQFGLKGPNHAAVTACASAASSIGDAYRMILFEDANVMLAGGSESALDPVSFAGFCRARALCTSFNERPAESSRPFDADRAGFVMGEGSGVLVLEELEHAKARGAKIYAEILGYGNVGDAYHITSPSPDGSGAIRCMRRALQTAGLSPSDVQYVNAHATSTPTGDKIEYSAIKEVFGGDDQSLPGVKVSSIKGSVGHLLGAAGAVESIATILSIRDGIVPPTLNFKTADADLVLDPKVQIVGHDVLRSVPIRAALSNSFGFGGTNTSLLFAKYE